ncbi:unnamed protein product, partial [Ostreobium quekettii]
GGDTLTVDKRRDPEVRRIKDCGDYETALAASTAVSEATKSIDPAEVVCPMGGLQKTTKDVQCCCGCDEE